MEPMLELEQPAMELETGKHQVRVQRWAEVAALDSGLGQVLGQGPVQELEQVEVKRLARMGPTTRLNLG
jgi:hypothetical protein